MDGPLKNLNLCRNWKMFFGALSNDAFGKDQLCEFASNAILNDILSQEHISLIRDIQKTFCEMWESDFFYLDTIENLFLGRDNSQFADTLKRELIARSGDRIKSDEVFRDALQTTVLICVDTTKSWINDRIICAIESSQLQRNQIDRINSRNEGTFEALDLKKISYAINSRDKTAFKSAVLKQEELDDGPRL